MCGPQRRRGAAPETLPAHDLATALNLMNERTLLAAFAGQTPGIPPDRVLDSLDTRLTQAVVQALFFPARQYARLLLRKASLHGEISLR